MGYAFTAKRSYRKYLFFSRVLGVPMNIGEKVIACVDGG